MNKIIAILLATTNMVACDRAADEPRAVGELTSERIELTAEFSEPITEILVREGETVSRGQRLLVQDSARIRTRFAELDATLGERQARLDELLRGPRNEQISAARASVEGATQDLGFKQSELTRVREIHRRGLTSADALDAANAALDAAQANLKVRLAQLEELLNGTTVEQLAQAEQAVRQAAARLDYVQVDLERHTITAPLDGVLDSRLFELGERPAVGQPVLVMLADKHPYARVFVPEPQRVNVHAGTAARVYVDGFDKPIDGRVRWVASEAAFTPYYALTERDRGRLSYVAKIDLVEQAERLPDGVPVEVEFLPNSDD